MEAAEFYQQVIAHIKKIPKGKVATYGQIAKLAGKEQGSRGVAWILNSSSKKHDLPWHRVLNAQGKISFPVATKNFRQQKKKLEAENIIFKESGGLDLAKYQWKKKPAHHSRKKTKRGSSRTPQMFA